MNEYIKAYLNALSKEVLWSMQTKLQNKCLPKHEELQILSILKDLLKAENEQYQQELMRKLLDGLVEDASSGSN